MYDYLCRGEDALGDDLRPESVLYHLGGCKALLKRHNRSVNRALQEGPRGVQSLAPHLLERIVDQRTLRLAWDFLACHGGTAPGPNGLRYTDLTSGEVWELCRCLSKALRNGSYGRGPDRTLLVSKGPGRGERP